MTVTTQELEAFPPEDLLDLHERLKFIGLVLSQLALLDVLVDTGAPATARVSAGRTLTEMAGDAQVLHDRMRSTALASKTPEELREMLEQIREGEKTVKDLLEE